MELLKDEKTATKKRNNVKRAMRRARHPLVDGQPRNYRPAVRKRLRERMKAATRHWEQRRARSRGWITEMHRAYARMLLLEFDTIVYPYFGVKQMVRNAGFNHLPQDVKWALLRQRHFKLRRYIEDRACTLGKEVIRVTEYYTTKECGKCGKRNDNVGGSVTFKCVNPACGAKMGRDDNAARNIMLQLYTGQ